MSPYVNKLLKTLAAALICTTSLVGQEAVFNTPFYYTRNVMNSSYAGMSSGIQTTLLYKQQWAGIEGAPTTALLNIDFPLTRKKGNNNAIGIGIINNQYATFSYTTVYIPNSYDLKLGKGGQSLRFGLAPKIVMNAIDLSQAIAEDPTDPTLANGAPSFTYLDANFGISYLISKEIAFGVSVDNFITNVFADRADLINYSNYSATTVNGDVRFYTPDLKKGAPRLFIDANVQHQLGLQTEFSGYARVGEIDQNIGVGYRSSGALMAIIQASVSTIQIAYSFEYTFTDIQSYTAGGHFIALRKLF